MKEEYKKKIDDLRLAEQAKLDRIAARTTELLQATERVVARMVGVFKDFNVRYDIRMKPQQPDVNTTVGRVLLYVKSPGMVEHDVVAEIDICDQAPPKFSFARMFTSETPTRFGEEEFIARWTAKAEQTIVDELGVSGPSMPALDLRSKVWRTPGTHEKDNWIRFEFFEEERDFDQAISTLAKFREKHPQITVEVHGLSDDEVQSFIAQTHAAIFLRTTHYERSPEGSTTIITME